ncbi:MAG TPA: lytic transglycosylase domain-containing protein [Firmicutes bacterium]|nr:lytic transglycosylase domain-containing protein [Bacillota bacterium]
MSSGMRRLGPLLLAFTVVLAIGRAECPLAYHGTIENTVQKLQLDWYLVVALIRVESKFKPTAVSEVGACGLMQLMPETAKEVASRNGLDFSHQMLFDPSYNIVVGCTYLKELMQRYQGDEMATLAAYNAGPKWVDKWLNGSAELSGDKIAFQETRQFVRKVLFYRRLYRALYSIPRTLFRPSTLMA